MATNTYVALKTTTVSNTTTASVDLDVSGITGYTDLVVVATVGSDTAGGQVIRMRFNGDTSSNYSRTYLSGSGSAPFSGRNTSLGYMPIDAYSNVPNGSGLYEANIIQIMNYNQTNTFKTVLSRSNMASYGVDTSVGSWFKSTKEAITLITLLTNTGYWSVGSTFTVYGIATGVAYPPSAKATGGTITYGVDGYTYHTFTSSSTFTPSVALTNVDYLVVAGGGGGGHYTNTTEQYNGGGGAGGLRCTVGATGGGGSLESKLSLSSGTGYTVTVGSGGAYNTNGSDSVFGSITSTGGGRGGAFYTGGVATGGSGGGAGGNTSSPNTSPGASGTANQGYAGGSGGRQGPGGYGTGGGGGGAGGVGANAANIDAAPGGAGGIGVKITELASATNTGVSNYYAGGGGGGAEGGTPGAGGAGGGGAGSTYGAGTAGTANTGGGGGSNAAGGSGIVIVRYLS
jgi:hypothetical protein